jgi:predicted XRE-type DNA-binding protein
MMLNNYIRFGGESMSRTIIRRSSGNVYQDLGLPNAEEMQAKAALVSRLVSILNNKKWTQEKAAEVLGIPQSKISLLSRGHFSGFSLGKLMKLLNRLNQDIEIRVKDRSHSAKHQIGHVSVTYV